MRRKGDFPEREPVAVPGPEQDGERYGSGNQLADDGRRRRPCNARPEQHDEQEVKHDVCPAARDEDDEGRAGVPDRPQDARTHVVDGHGNHAQEEDAQVEDRLPVGVGGCPDEREHGRGEQYAQDGHEEAADQAERQRRMHGAGNARQVFCPVELGYEDPAPAREPHEEADDEVHEYGGTAADGGKRFLADKTADDDRVNRIVELLEKSPEQDGKEEGKQGLPDGPLNDGCGISRKCALHDDGFHFRALY